MSKPKIGALAYLRTSSSTNVGADKDSDKRQKAAIASFAKKSGYAISEGDWFYDAAVSGADPIETRPGFNAMLSRIAGNCVRVVIVEDATRFARGTVTQELGIMMLMKLGVKVYTANGTELTATDDEGVLIRQIFGAVAQFEKNKLVAKMKAARDRKKAETGKCGGRKSYAEKKNGAQLIEAARKLNDGRSLDKIAAALEAQGFVTAKGNRFSASSVKSILGSEKCKSRKKRSTVKQAA